jgi:endopolyphosphatase
MGPRYFFTSNSGVDGCANKHEPGYEHMEWLRIQLELFRERGIKAILMGHVPPARVGSKESWDETCWQKYTLWQRQFRDVIVGNLYGHMNIDHFMLQDFEQISKDAEKGRMARGKSAETLQEGDIGLYEDGEVTVASASDYLLQLREAWAQLPAPAPKSNKQKRARVASGYDEEEDMSLWDRWMSIIKWQSKDGKAQKDEKKKYLEKIGGKFAERYSITHVAPSVVPNYFPTLRIIEYNISGLEHTRIPSSSSHTPPSEHSAQHPIITSDYLDDSTYTEEDSPAELNKKHRKAPKRYKFKIPNGPSKSSPPGPAYSPQPLTWTRYTQYFANLTRINNDFVEAVSSHNHNAPHTIFGLGVSATGEIDHQRWKEGKHGKHQGKQPRPEPHPTEFAYEVEYDTQSDRGFPDLTVRRWIEYARKIGHAGEGKGKGVDGEVEDEDEWEVEDEEEQAQGKKHKKKKHHKKKHDKASREWYTFVKRAFVGTMDPREIEDVFGATRAGGTGEENMDL